MPELVKRGTIKGFSLAVSKMKSGQKRKECSRRESNPRPLVHKTSALPIELQELA